MGSRASAVMAERRPGACRLVGYSPALGLGCGSEFPARRVSFPDVSLFAGALRRLARFLHRFFRGACACRNALATRAAHDVRALTQLLRWAYSLTLILAALMTGPH